MNRETLKQQIITTYFNDLAENQAQDIYNYEYVCHIFKKSRKNIKTFQKIFNLRTIDLAQFAIAVESIIENDNLKLKRCLI
jgi:hypothetical protein